MQEEMSKIADVVYYGVNGGKFIPEFNVEKIVEKENPDVLVFWSTQLPFHNIDKVKVPKFCKCGDPHPPNVKRHISFINKNGIDLAGFGLWDSQMKQTYNKIKCKPIRLLRALDISIFRDLYLNRDLDVYFGGSFSPKYYPFRHTVFNNLPKEFKCLIKHIKVQNVNEQEWTHQLNEYIRLLNRAKIVPFGNGIYNYAVKRNYEARACGALVMSPIPRDVEVLHFIPNEDYVEINRNNYIDKIQYYIKHENERNQIIKRGWEIINKHHSTKIRASQLLNYLKELIE